MAKKSNSGWRPVQLPKDLVDEVERIVKTNRVKKQGVTSISQFIARTVNEELKKLESARMSRVNVYEDRARIMDDRIGKMGRIVSVYFKRGKGPWCDYCSEDDCVHVQYAWELPDARKILKRHGMKYPRSIPAGQDGPVPQDRLKGRAGKG